MNIKKAVGVGIASFVALFAVCIGLVFLVGAVSRYQSRADASNNIAVARRQLAISKLQAQIRYQQSIGIRKSQDEIAKTLTPLYVAFEMTQALQAIATSGQNNSVIYLPTSPKTGLPVVPISNKPNSNP